MRNWRGVSWVALLWTPIWVLIGIWAVATSSPANGSATISYFVGPMWLLGMIVLAIVWRNGRRDAR